MQRNVAFLRGINLGKRRLSMSRLKSLFEELGFVAVETFIASGNVLFSTKSTASRLLESRIGKHLESSLGYKVETFVRTAEEVTKVGGATIFPEDGREESIIHVGFLHDALPPGTARKFMAVRTETDEFHVVGREYYWQYRGLRTSDSTVWALAEIKALRLPTATLRNLKTIRKLIAKHLTRAISITLPVHRNQDIA